ncbi:fibronectin type III domain-containing protein [Persicitalea jodogahamensis]
MTFNRSLLSQVLVLLFSPLVLLGQTELPTLVAPANWQQQGIEIRLRDDLKHPTMNWPLTRLRYIVDFTAADVPPDSLRLWDTATDRPIPFQLSEVQQKNGRVQKATLNFLSDLPSGGDKTFRLVAGSPNNRTAATPVFSVVTVQKYSHSLVLANGLIKIELPISVDSEGKAWPPVLRIGNGTAWLGKGYFDLKKPLTSFTLTEGSLGPLMAEYTLNYQFEKEKWYRATVRLVAGMEFLELEETMQGFDSADSLAWQLVWDNFKPDYRYTPNRTGSGFSDPKNKNYDNVAWEPIDGAPSDPTAQKHPQLPYDQQSRTGGQLPFEISPYDNWISWWKIPTAAFWNESQNQSIGLFIKDLEKWDDGEYALWVSSDKLSIRFLYNADLLRWHFPLVQGTRSTALALYPHQKDIQEVNRTQEPLAYIDYLRRWYGWIPLDKVKNWVLDYDMKESKQPLFFKPVDGKAASELKDLERSLENQVGKIADQSERANGPNPVGTRVFYEDIFPAWDAYSAQMSSDQYQHLRAAFLFMTYVFMDESLMPMRTMLSGHPNFLADVKGVPGLAAAIFPNHPKAQDMADHYEKSVALNMKYHVRPDVPAWQAKGGRWTENLATYTWAYLKPTLRTSFLLHHHYDGRNRLLQPNLSLYANWLLNSLTAPLEQADGRRVNPPQGAHAHGLTPSNLLRMLGQEMAYYDPLLAEHLFYVTSPDDHGFEYKVGRFDPWGGILRTEFSQNKGTKPRLRSEKYTGYGYVLRHYFGAPNETYVHLQQIDEGPNYRWGRAANGGNGVIYYYANGKRYSHNGIEDVGDAPFGDVERCTNFGVKKLGGYRSLGPYRSVGQNDLTEPLSDFGFAQFAQVNANEEVQPDYHSRSVLQSGGDYIVIFDDVEDSQTEGRFSWFVGKEDDFPFIQQLSPGAPLQDADIQPSKSNYHDDKGVLSTKGRYYDGKGDFLTFVSHKSGIKAQKTAYGCLVRKEENATDYVFRNSTEVVFNQAGMRFQGTSGIIQQNLDKSYNAALFRGNQLGVPGILVTLNPSTNSSLSLQSDKDGFRGVIQAQQEISLIFTRPAGANKEMMFYVDGEPLSGKAVSSNKVQLTLSPGTYVWQWNSTGVIPSTPVILGTTHRSQGGNVSWNQVPGADTYQLQMSLDGGESWKTSKDMIKGQTTSLTGLANGTKIHVRVRAKGKGGWSVASDEYPIFVTDQVPHAPEGLLVRPEERGQCLTWGRILGASRYYLYRRAKDSASDSAQLIYSGPESTFLDKSIPTESIAEYWVKAENGNGISKESTHNDTDSKRLINWYPKPDENFRRDTRNHENGYDEYNPFIEEAKPVLFYPEK